MTPTHFHSWFAFVNRLLHGDALKPDPNGYKVLLSLADDFHPAMSSESVFARELSFNYGRVASTWEGLGSVDLSLNLHAMPETLFTITAADQDLFFRSLVMVADCQTTQTCVSVTGINTVTGNITTAGAHSFSTGDRALLLTDGERPVNIPNVFYSIQRLSPTVVRLQNAQGKEIIPTTPGSGNLRLAYVQAPSQPYFFHTFDQLIQIPSGASKTYRLVSRVRGL